MKYGLWKRCAAMLAAACIMTPMLAVSAGAEEDGSMMLPSGHPLEWVTGQIEYMAGDSGAEDFVFMPYASFEAVVFQGGEIKYEYCYGDYDMENHIPADQDTVYEWGSISKTMVWVSVMQLWEQGLIDLEADVRTYLPDGFFQHLRYDDPITMLDLMNHTAGFAEPVTGFFLSDADAVMSLEETLQMTEPAQIARPGEMTGYSNWGAALAGYIVERISGMDYCDYVHKNILEPLGMEHTAVNAFHSDNAWVQQQREKMKSYQVSVISTVRVLGSCMSYIALYPAGSATGTIGDLTRYAQAFVDDSAPLFQNPETQQMMLSGSSFFGKSDIPESCYGFASMEYGVRTIGHDGSTFGYQSMMLFDPETKIGMVSLTNDPNGGAVCPLFPEFVFGTASQNAYPADADAEPMHFSGYYLPARSTQKGMLKVQSYLSAMRMDNDKEFEAVAEDCYRLSDPNSTLLLGLKHYSDGKIGLGFSSMDYIEAPAYLPMLYLLAAYVLTAVISFYALRVKHRLRCAGRQQKSFGGGIRAAAQFAKIGSGLLLIVAAGVYTKFYGIPKFLSTAIGLLQIACIAVCAAAAVLSVISLLKQSEIRRKLTDICSFAGNVIAICAMIAFEMYQFWGC